MAAVAVVVAVTSTRIAANSDRVGLGWRDALAAGIFNHLDQIDLVEVIADDHFNAPHDQMHALASLATTVPLTLHGVTLGLASSIAVAPQRLERMARLVERLQPVSWSEHLAFVRAGGIEIGHLAAPPRTPESVAGTLANLALAAKVVGSLPLLENIATLIDPPASSMDEAEWISAIVQGSGASMLLDLHNLYANAVNFGHSPAALLLRLPLHKVKAVHLSGGHWIKQPGGTGRRLLDDHIHDVPTEVFELLTLLAQHAPPGLDVIIERDGKFPPFTALLQQIQQTRLALQIGRARAQEAA
ncbi:MAG: DUF692 family protein [Burkholderiales bacterium]|nr:DUF692 family protein [Burkholderiales bacterium]